MALWQLNWEDIIQKEKADGRLFFCSMSCLFLTYARVIPTSSYLQSWLLKTHSRSTVCWMPRKSWASFPYPVIFKETPSMPSMCKIQLPHSSQLFDHFRHTAKKHSLSKSRQCKLQVPFALTVIMQLWSLCSSLGHVPCLTLKSMWRVCKPHMVNHVWGTKGHPLTYWLMCSQNVR